MKKGFTLLEIVVSIGLLIVIAASFTTLSTQSLKTSLNSERFLLALNLSQSYMEKMRQKPFDELQNISFNKNAGKIETKIISNDLKELHLIYKWDAKKKPIEIYTMRSKYE